MARRKTARKQRKKLLKGLALRQHVIDTITMIFNDPELKSTQLNSAEVARRAGCSRQYIYKVGLDILIAQKQSEKAKSDAEKEKLRKSHKTTHVLLLQKIKRLQEQLKQTQKDKDEAEQFMWTLFIQVEANSPRLEVKEDLIRLLNTPVSPIASREDGSSAGKRRNRESLFPDLLAWGRLYKEAQARRVALSLKKSNLSSLSEK